MQHTKFGHDWLINSLEAVAIKITSRPIETGHPSDSGYLKNLVHSHIMCHTRYHCMVSRNFIKIWSEGKKEYDQPRAWE